MDQQTGKALEKRIVTRQLFEALKVNTVPLSEDFDDLPRFLPFSFYTSPLSVSVSSSLSLPVSLFVSLTLMISLKCISSISRRTGNN